MVLDFPDYYGGMARIAIPGYQPGIITMTATGQLTLDAGEVVLISVGSPAEDEMWKFSRLTVYSPTDSSALLEASLAWWDGSSWKKVYNTRGYGTVEIWLPDGLRYPYGGALAFYIGNPNNIPLEVVASVAWVVETVI